MTDYNPDTVSHPSETIRETLQEQGKGVAELVRAGMDEERAQELVEGERRIRPLEAILLERVTGVSMMFWVRRQAQYDAWKLKSGE